MERVNGIGGVFFRAENPDLLSNWYATQLGVEEPPNASLRRDRPPR